MTKLIHSTNWLTGDPETHNRATCSDPELAKYDVRFFVRSEDLVGDDASGGMDAGQVCQLFNLLYRVDGEYGLYEARVIDADEIAHLPELIKDDKLDGATVVMEALVRRTRLAELCLDEMPEPVDDPDDIERPYNPEVHADWLICEDLYDKYMFLEVAGEYYAVHSWVILDEAKRLEQKRLGNGQKEAVLRPSTTEMDNVPGGGLDASQEGAATYATRCRDSDKVDVDPTLYKGLSKQLKEYFNAPGETETERDLRLAYVIRWGCQPHCAKKVGCVQFLGKGCEAYQFAVNFYCRRKKLCQVFNNCFNKNIGHNSKTNNIPEVIDQDGPLKTFITAAKAQYDASGI